MRKVALSGLTGAEGLFSPRVLTGTDGLSGERCFVLDSDSSRTMEMRLRDLELAACSLTSLTLSR